ncbi:NAD(P)/FAD-dependent oxidoreductase [Sphingobacterium corticibacter]|uniref:Pyridine nucleotide-disulfide oxidoreductase n=1 Tax=Sphingobacterium corticibacter TaxID=2171749 RepID=A0A2T8HL92_9SPHI|nr:NAD(P)/FAD-dependent oxidoreductase [Sphingobacterium corticibacter]PVH26163.1 pyridine nucleotide-disulfide oxidoreductase [Sphingobacterium corticibacter]
MKHEEIFDTIILGGSYAGLSAAMALGRSLRKVLVIDNGQPCNRQTPHSHNFLTQDGKTPAEIAAVAREQVAQYDTVQFLSDSVVTASSSDDIFTVTTSTQNQYQAKKIIIGTGIRDIMPEIPGFAACWGISVIHCPYCHGYEFRGKRNGILVPEDPAAALHLSGLVQNLSDDVTLFTNGRSPFDDEQLLNFKNRSIQINSDKITEITHQNGNIEHLAFDNGKTTALDALYARVPFDLHHDIAEQLGCSKTEMGLLQVDAFQKTTVPGVYACGDICNPMRSVATAVYTGNLAGAMVNMALCEAHS